MHFYNIDHSYQCFRTIHLLLVLLNILFLLSKLFLLHRLRHLLTVPTYSVFVLFLKVCIFKSFLLNNFFSNFFTYVLIKKSFIKNIFI